MSILPQEEIISKFLNDYPESAANVIAFSDQQDFVDLFEKYPVSLLAKVFNKLPTQVISENLIEINVKKVASLFSLMDVNIVARVLRNWKQEKLNSKYESILKMMSADSSKAIENIVNYPENVIGSIMDNTPPTTSPNTALKSILLNLSKSRNRYSKFVYVVDNHKKLSGVISFKDVFYDNKNSLASELMTSQVYSIQENTSIESAISDPGWIKWESIPIVNNKKEIQGVLKFETLRNYHESKETKKLIDNSDIMKAGEAVGEILHIGLNATISAFGMSKGDKK